MYPTSSQTVPQISLLKDDSKNPLKPAFPAATFQLSANITQLQSTQKMATSIFQNFFEEQSINRETSDTTATGSKASNPFSLIIATKQTHVQSNSKEPSALISSTAPSGLFKASPFMHEPQKQQQQQQHDNLEKQCEAYFQSLYLELIREMASNFIFTQRILAPQFSEILVDQVIKEQIALMGKILKFTFGNDF